MRKSNTIKIGKALQNLRKSYGYTQEKMAEAIEVSTRYIGDIEQDRAKPSYEVFSDTSGFCGCRFRCPDKCCQGPRTKE